MGVTLLAFFTLMAATHEVKTARSVLNDTLPNYSKWVF